MTQRSGIRIPPGRISGITNGYPGHRRTAPTVALREPEGRSLDLRRSAGTWSDLGVGLPLLSAGDPGSRSFAAPARPIVGHVEGMAGEDDVPLDLPAMVASSGDG
jgi:hypothetical protein